MGCRKLCAFGCTKFLLELAEARRPSERLMPFEMFLSEENYNFFAGGQPNGDSEDKILRSLEAVAVVIRGTLRDRGYKPKAK